VSQEVERKTEISHATRNLHKSEDGGTGVERLRGKSLAQQKVGTCHANLWFATCRLTFVSPDDVKCQKRLWPAKESPEPGRHPCRAILSLVNSKLKPRPLLVSLPLTTSDSAGGAIIKYYYLIPLSPSS
jgi:hypothetical protein